jgi:hypothetical protein
MIGAEGVAGRPRERRMRSRLRHMVPVGLLGAAGGAANAWLCWAKLPAPIRDGTLEMSFRWLVIPGGAIHGAALAVLGAWAALALARRPAALRLAAAPVVGWVVGYLSWIPLARWAADGTWAQSLLWVQGRGLDALWVPFAHFGLVAALLYLLLVAGAGRRPALAFGAAIAAGVGGSLWWWIVWDRWWFAPLHGAVWGALVGLGLARAARFNAASRSRAV